MISNYAKDTSSMYEGICKSRQKKAQSLKKCYDCFYLIWAVDPSVYLHKICDNLKENRFH